MLGTTALFNASYYKSVGQLTECRETVSAECDCVQKAPLHAASWRWGLCARGTRGSGWCRTDRASIHDGWHASCGPIWAGPHLRSQRRCAFSMGSVSKVPGMDIPIPGSAFKIDETRASLESGRGNRRCAMTRACDVAGETMRAWCCSTTARATGPSMHAASALVTGDWRCGTLRACGERVPPRGPRCAVRTHAPRHVAALLRTAWRSVLCRTNPVDLLYSRA